MTIGVNVKVKTLVNFDRIKKSVHKMNISSIRHGSAYIRKIARNSIKYRLKKRDSSLAGTPPHTHAKGKNMGIRKAIIYAVDQNDAVGVIGVGFSNLLDIDKAHELGGWYKFSRYRETRFYPKRPFMLPALNKASPKLPSFWESRLRK